MGIGSRTMWRRGRGAIGASFVSSCVVVGDGAGGGEGESRKVRVRDGQRGWGCLFGLMYGSGQNGLHV